jgi:deazaflavin-dependent oxidoreductase (nitroreductase family)
MSQPPRGLWRLLARLPIWLYRFRLGWLLGHRFLMLTHIGRKSRLPRYTVVEVVRYDKTTDTYFIVSGFGEKADWFRNICKTPQVTIHTDLRCFAATAERVSLAEAGREFQDYAQRHPVALKALARVLDYPWDGTAASYERLAQLLPIIRLQPTSLPVALVTKKG